MLSLPYPSSLSNRFGSSLIPAAVDALAAAFGAASGAVVFSFDISFVMTSSGAAVSSSTCSVSVDTDSAASAGITDALSAGTGSVSSAPLMTGIRVNIIAITVSILTASLRFVFFISDLLFDNIILRLVHLSSTGYLSCFL